MQKAEAEVTAVYGTEAGANDEPTYTAWHVDLANNGYEINLEVRLKNGNSVGCAYSYLVSPDCEGNGKITLEYTNRTVTIKGRHLRELYQRILDHAVQYVQEYDLLQHGEVDEDVPCIDSIQIQR